MIAGVLNWVWSRRSSKGELSRGAALERSSHESASRLNGPPAMGTRLRNADAAASQPAAVRNGHRDARGDDWNGRRPNMGNGRGRRSAGLPRFREALPIPDDTFVSVGEPTPIDGIVANPSPGFTVVEYQIFSLHQSLIPVDAIAVEIIPDGKQEIVFCDLTTHNAFVFDASPQGEPRSQRMTPLVKPGALGKLVKPSSLVLTACGSKIGVKDDDGVHFFDAASKAYLTSTIGLKSVYGLEVYDDNFLVTLDDNASKIIFIDADIGEITNRGVGVQGIDRSAAIQRDADENPRADGRPSKFRFLAVDGGERGEKRAALTDWGLNRVHVGDLSSGKLLYTVGGYGGSFGQFHDPAGVVFLPDGQLAVADRKNGRIQTFGADGSFRGLIQLPPTVTQPVGLFLQDAANDKNTKYLYVTHYKRQPGITKLTLRFEE